MDITLINEEEYLELSNELRNAIRDVPDFLSLELFLKI